MIAEAVRIQAKSPAQLFPHRFQGGTHDLIDPVDHAAFGDIPASKMESVLANLRNYHINGLQYYDWLYDHHHPLAGTPSKPDSEWPSLIGTTVQLATVKGYIEKAHTLGIASMWYDLCYGALSWAADDGVDEKWYAFKDSF